MPNESRIVIVDCCGVRFSKIIDEWVNEPVVGREIDLVLFPKCLWTVDVYLILLKKGPSNGFEYDAVFTKSEDGNLALRLIDSLGKNGWFEKEDACLYLERCR